MVLNTPTLAFSPRFNLARGGALEESDERLGGKRRRETGELRELRELGKSGSAQGGKAEETFEWRAKTYAACETHHSRRCDVGCGVGGLQRLSASNGIAGSGR